MVEKSCTVSAKLCSFQHIFCVQDTTNKRVKYSNFLNEVGRSWISEVQNQSESNSDDLQLPEKQTTPREPKQDPPGRLYGDFRIHKLEKIGGGGDKGSILQDCKVWLCIRSEVKLDTFVNWRCSASQRVLFCEIAFSDELLDYLHAVSAVWGSGA